jgi:hypothetical protein
MSVATELLYPALRLAGILGAPGRTASTSELADAFDALNRMLGSWSVQDELIYSIQVDRYNLSPSKTSYTIGPTGADFIAPRPIRITQATLVLLGPSELHLPLTLLTDAQWAYKRLREIPTSVPTELYDDYDFPNSRLYLWGYPTVANDLELFTWQTLSSFPSQAAAVSLPPGYANAIVYNLAVQLNDQFGTPIRPNVLTTARRTSAWLKGNNATSPAIPSADFGTRGSQHSGQFNWVTGMPR